MFYFNLESSKELWKSVTMVSTQGSHRGRARGLLKIKNLHRGQKLGVGKAKIAFPGLSDVKDPYTGRPKPLHKHARIGTIPGNQFK